MSGRESLEVPPEAAGARLDRFLADRAGGFPTRSRFARLIEGGSVLVNGRAAKPAQAVRAGDVVVIEHPEPEASALTPESIPLSILFEDEHLIVVNKPAGLVVHPGAGVRTGTLVHALLHHTAALSPGGSPERPGIVHRLDKETSGLLVVARSEAVHVALTRALAARRVRRAYAAVVWGAPPAEGAIDAPIGRHARDRKRMGVRPDGRPSRTTYRVDERFSFAALLAVTLDTGRTHQIRVHMAHAGHPVFGDPLYGGRQSALPRFASGARAEAARLLLDALPRQALHARQLAFDHPVSGRPMLFEAPFPEDLAALLGALRKPPAA